MKNEETKQEEPRLKFDKGLDASPTGQAANSGEESKGPFEATNTPSANKKAAAEAVQITDLSDHDSDEDIVPGEDQTEEAE